MKQRLSHKELIRENPWKLVRSLYYTLVYLVLVIQNRFLLPFACRAVDIRTELARCFLAAFLGNFWDLIFKAPPWLRKDQYSDITLKGVPAVLIPPNASIRGMKNGSNSDRKRKVFLLYAHGGGYLFGEPLMYISTYERWIKKAFQQGLDLVIVSVDYGDPCLTLKALADESKWPSCRDDFIRAHEALLTDYQIDARDIVFGGDSAGGGLVAMSALEIGRRNLPMPGGLLLISPWADLAMESTLRSPAMATDFLVTFTKDNPELVRMLLPDGMSPADPRVSPIFDNLKGLPPQLVLAGTVEVLLHDSKEWTRRSLEAGNNVKLVLEQGQMHIYAMGYPFASKTIEAKTDKSIIQFFMDYRDVVPKKFQ